MTWTEGKDRARPYDWAQQGKLRYEVRPTHGGYYAIVLGPRGAPKYAEWFTNGVSVPRVRARAWCEGIAVGIAAARGQLAR